MIHLDLNVAHPVARLLKAKIDAGLRLDGNVQVEDAVFRYGRPFIGMARPKQFRPRAIKRCFDNAGNLASEERGIYVEGFAMRLDDRGYPFHHAWITVDGVHAIDVTLRDVGPDVSYFGIPFSPRVFSRWLCKRGYWTFLNAHDEDMGELLADISRDPPIF
jgi:hypothetical protein